MNGYNRVMVMGFLGRDPEMRYVGSNNKPVANISLGCPWSSKQQDGSFKEEVEWINVTIWGKMAEAVSKHLAKSSWVFIEGRMKTDKWEKDGETRYITKVVAERVNFLPKKGGDPAPSAGSHQGAGGDAFMDDDIPF